MSVHSAARFRNLGAILSAYDKHYALRDINLFRMDFKHNLTNFTILKHNVTETQVKCLVVFRSSLRH